MNNVKRLSLDNAHPRNINRTDLYFIYTEFYFFWFAEIPVIYNWNIEEKSVNYAKAIQYFK